MRIGGATVKSAARDWEDEMKRLWIIAAALLVAACTAPPVNRDGTVPLRTVSSVDLSRYLGKWYEIARFENGFEEDCVGVMAEYARKDDGTIAITNTCRKRLLDGPVDVAEGTARVVEPETNAKLAVSFDPLGLFEGDYWVIALEENYQWALVGEPEGRYLWFLARTPQINDAVRARALEELERYGYNTSALHWTPQPGG